jgi:hypothetical protein
VFCCGQLGVAGLFFVRERERERVEFVCERVDLDCSNAYSYITLLPDWSSCCTINRSSEYLMLNCLMMYVPWVLESLFS